MRARVLHPTRPARWSAALALALLALVAEPATASAAIVPQPGVRASVPTEQMVRKTKFVRVSWVLVRGVRDDRLVRVQVLCRPLSRCRRQRGTETKVQRPAVIDGRKEADSRKFFENYLLRGGEVIHVQVQRAGWTGRYFELVIERSAAGRRKVVVRSSGCLRPPPSVRSARAARLVKQRVPCPVVATPGLYRKGWWNFSNRFGDGWGDLSSHSFFYGDPSAIPVLGDWNADGIDTPGFVLNGHWSLSDTSASGGPTPYSFDYGTADDVPVVGDWDGDGYDTPGFRRGGTFFLSDTFGGPTTHYIGYGLPGDRVVAGDWDGDGIDTPGIIRDNQWGLSNTMTSNGPATTAHGFQFGEAEAQYVVGDWDGDGRDTPGFRNKYGMWFLSNGVIGARNIFFRYGNPDDLIVAGKTHRP